MILRQNVDGGIIELVFEPMVESLASIGLLDIDYATIIKITFQNDFGQMEDKNIMVPIYGDNSYQLFPLADFVSGPVKKLKLIMTRSGAITSLTFCPS
jgi:hypothetical protein